MTGHAAGWRNASSYSVLRGCFGCTARRVSGAQSEDCARTDHGLMLEKTRPSVIIAIGPSPPVRRINSIMSNVSPSIADAYTVARHRRHSAMLTKWSIIRSLIFHAASSVCSGKLRIRLSAY